MENLKKFDDLFAYLHQLLKSESYSASTLRDMDFILNTFADYMRANGLDEYSPEVGDDMVKYCKKVLHICESRVVRAKTIVAKLNRLSSGLDGKDALWAEKTKLIALPDGLSTALEDFISHCRENGNKPKPLNIKDGFVANF